MDPEAWEESAAALELLGAGSRGGGCRYCRVDAPSRVRQASEQAALGKRRRACRDVHGTHLESTAACWNPGPVPTRQARGREAAVHPPVPTGRPGLLQGTAVCGLVP